MNQATLHSLQQQLQHIAERVRTDASLMVELARSGSGGQGGGSLSNVPMHLADMGTDEFLYDLNATLLENAQFIESEVREALRRIEGGTFGNCEGCGRPIARERLEVVPYTRYCVKCASSRDRTPSVSLDTGRPHTPADTLAPEGEMEEDRRRRVDPLEFPLSHTRRGDVHAAGTAGGGTAVGGLAGSNEGDGDPVIVDLDEATASGRFDADDDRSDDRTPRSGPSGGAVGGTPARKRSV
jgi:RNA polymerase-binding transcription factor DksA